MRRGCEISEQAIDAKKLLNVQEDSMQYDWEGTSLHTRIKKTKAFIAWLALLSVLLVVHALKT